MAQHNHYGHRQRLKDRFLQTGFTGFDAHGILELLLFYSIPIAAKLKLFPVQND